MTLGVGGKKLRHAAGRARPILELGQIQDLHLGLMRGGTPKTGAYGVERAWRRPKNHPLGLGEKKLPNAIFQNPPTTPPEGSFGGFLKPYAKGF